MTVGTIFLLVVYPALLMIGSKIFTDLHKIFRLHDIYQTAWMARYKPFAFSVQKIHKFLLKHDSWNNIPTVHIIMTIGTMSIKKISKDDEPSEQVSVFQIKINQTK